MEVHKYFVGEPLPPHLSPFISEERRVGDYVPPEEKEMLGLNAKKEVLEQEKEPEESEEEDEVIFFVTKIVLTYCEKKCCSDREKLLKFEAEG